MSNSEKPMSGEELGNKLLKSVMEMKAGKAARATQIAPNEVASARMKTGLTQTEFACYISQREHCKNGSRVEGSPQELQKR